MKRAFTLILTITIVLSTFSISFAADDQFSADLGYTEDEIALMEIKNFEAMEEYNNYKDKLSRSDGLSVKAMPVTSSYLIDVPNYKQERNNWCGPACVRQTLAFHAQKGGISVSNVPSQSTLASALGIYNSGGASTASMTNLINSYKSSLGFSNYTYSKCNFNNQSNKVEWLYSMMKTRMVGKKCAPILLFETGTAGGLQNYVGYTYRHYNTISGVQETIDANTNNIMGRYIRRVDPHYNSSFRGVYYDPLANVAESLALADTNGSNYVIIY